MLCSRSQRDTFSVEMIIFDEIRRRDVCRLMAVGSPPGSISRGHREY